MDQMTYEGSGIDYDGLDAFKRKAQRAIRHLWEIDDDQLKLKERLGVKFCEDTVGESVQLFRNGNHYLGHVNEGLGTKNLVADAMDTYCMPGVYYDSIARDTVAMIVNDMATLGVFPFDIKMQIAIGDAKWMRSDARIERLISGWQWACAHSGALWSGGETPILKDMINPECAVLSGSAVGKTIGLNRFSSKKIRAGDAIVFFESSGIHANGLTLARAIAKKLEREYLTEVPGTNGNFADALLQPTLLYAKAVEHLVREGIEIHYAVNITGHGWRKLMRAPQPFTYLIEKMPKRQPVFDLIQEKGHICDEEMYGTFNMGAGFALFIAESSMRRFWEAAGMNRFPFGFMEAGRVEAGEKQVVIEPKNLAFKADTLSIR